jgi:gamma-glutamyltranspeptidase/glutathione hydrolase
MLRRGVNGPLPTTMRHTLALLLGAALCSCSKPRPGPRGTSPDARAVVARAAATAAPSIPGSDATTPMHLDVAPGDGAVSGRHGVVTSVEAQATRVGIDVLQRGGNAIDAAVAIGYALAVTHPSAGNVGGGGFMLVRKRGGPTVAVDFRETAPRGLTREAFDRMIASGARGPVSVGIPGSVAGLNLALRSYGRLELPEVLAPAIALARDGFIVGARQAKTFAWSWPVLTQDAGARATFGALPPRSGVRLRNPDLATVLERIAAAADAGFYRGPTAEALVKSLASAHVTLDDLSSYRAVIREPLRFAYRDLLVETMPPPSAGGVVLMQVLRMVEQLGAHRLGADPARELHYFLEASRRAQAERRFAVTDPDAIAEPERRERMNRFQDVAALLERHPIVAEKATPSSEVHPLYQAAARELEHTTHYSVVDAQGTAVSCTMTLSAGFGAKLVAPGTGFVLNNAVASFGTIGENIPRAGRRTVSSMAPTLVLQNESVVLVLGSPGGDTIPSTIAQILRRVVDHGQPLADAVRAPRLHHGFVPDEVRYERERPPPRAVLDQLVAWGHRLSTNRKTMGDANVIAVSNDQAHAVADGREGGLALAAAPAPHRAPR